MVMSLTWTWLLNLLVPLLGQLIKLVSPAIMAELGALATQLYLKAMATPNPWDDMLCGFLLDILGIPRPPPAT
jgi:hypothetical protein